MFQFDKLLVATIAALLIAQVGMAAEPVVVATGSSAHAPRQPQLAIDSSGVIHIAFGQEKSVFYSQSKDSGRTYSQPMQLPEAIVFALGRRRGPRIAASGENICISFVSGKQEGRGDLLAYCSTDSGKTWSAPVTVNDAPAAAREGLHAMAAGPRGAMCCVWLDLRSGKTEVYAATSTNGGKTWDKNVRVYRSPSGTVCECCHPSVTHDASGALHVMWRNALGGARDMYLSSSSDSGKLFSSAVKLGKGTWPLEACPMDGGYLAVSPTGGMFTAWRRDKEVFLTMPQSVEERRLGSGQQPWIAATARGPFVVWLESRTGRLLLQTPDDAKPQELSSKASDPVIACSPDGRGPLVAAWEERRGNDAVVVCEVLQSPP
jgi:hypothetical protein